MRILLFELVGVIVQDKLGTDVKLLVKVKVVFAVYSAAWKFGLVSTLRPVIADAGILERPAPDPLNWVAYNCPVLELNVRLLPV
jgi:hypothetical protein